MKMDVTKIDHFMKVLKPKEIVSELDRVSAKPS